MKNFLLSGMSRVCFAPDDGGAGAGAAGGGTGDAAAAAAAAAATPWYTTAGADAEMTGYLQNKGWDKLDPGKAAIEAARAHQEAAKLIGAPPDQVLRIAKPEDAVGTAAMWGRLGRPQDAKGYDLSNVKFADGTALDQPFIDAFTQAAHAANLPSGAAAQVAQAFVKFMDAADLSDATEKAATLAGQKDALGKNWGQNFNANMIIAQNAARALGVKPEEVAALEGIVGYDRVMEMFRSIGQRIGEDRYVGPNGASGAGVMTREQAISRKAELMADGEWVKRYMNGGAMENREMQAVLKLITGEAGNYTA